MNSSPVCSVSSGRVHFPEDPASCEYILISFLNVPYFQLHVWYLLPDVALVVQCVPCHCQASQLCNGMDFQSFLLSPLITMFRTSFSVARCCQAALVPLTWRNTITEFPKPCFVYFFWAICLTFKLNPEFFLYLASSLMPPLSWIF